MKSLRAAPRTAKAAAFAVFWLIAAPVAAQQKSTSDGIAEYRKMLEDGNL